MVSRDADLLDLNNDSTFRWLLPRTQVVDPVTFLREIERWRELHSDHYQDAEAGREPNEAD